MAAAKGGPRKTKKVDEATAAQEEASGTPRTIQVRGHDIIIPAEPPFAVLFAARTAETAQRERSDAGAAVALLELAEAYVGSDQVRSLVNGLSLEDGTGVVQEIIQVCSDAYGMTVGESTASSSS